MYISEKAAITIAITIQVAKITANQV
jgi:hypothetical protein